MTIFGKLARATTFALCLSAQTQALAAVAADPIHVLCDEIRLIAVCDALVAALSDAQDKHEVVKIAATDTRDAAHLTVRFEASRFTEHVLAGRLAWTGRDGRPGTGPEVELTVMDATINEAMLRDYARQLLGLTDLPI